MKIDCHVHLYARSDTSGGYNRPGFVREQIMQIIARRFGIDKRAGDEEAERIYLRYLAESVANAEIDRAVLLAFDQIYQQDGTLDDRSRFYVPNAYAARACAQYPDRFWLGASVHPHRTDALEALDRVKEAGAVLVKLLPNSQGFDPADASLVPYYRKLAELRLPLLAHCGYEHAIPVLDQSLGDPARLRLALDEGVTVIVAHAGTAGRFHRHETFGAFLRLLNDHPNCYGDTSALANFWRSHYLKALLDPERLEKRYGVVLENPFDRLIHGSDFPAPVTPLAFGVKKASQIRASVEDPNNVLQLDIASKRAMGVPDACMERGGELLRPS